MNNYNEIFRKKTKTLAIEIITALSKRKYSDEVSIIRKQIIKSSTSTAANYRAVGRARSDKERFAKLSIVIEEADETLFWLEVIEELKWLEDNELNALMTKTEEIVKATSAYRKKLTSN